jgi:hypothetical protein
MANWSVVVGNIWSLGYKSDRLPQFACCDHFCTWQKQDEQEEVIHDKKNKRDAHYSPSPSRNPRIFVSQEDNRMPIDIDIISWSWLRFIDVILSHLKVHLHLVSLIHQTADPRYSSLFSLLPSNSTISRKMSLIRLELKVLQIRQLQCHYWSSLMIKI